MNNFLNLNLWIIFDELKVFDVIKILSTILFFSSFSKIGTILFISPTLAP